jgi:hypothetical protein
MRLAALVMLALLAAFTLGCSADPQISPQAAPFFLEGDIIMVDGQTETSVIREVELGADGAWSYQVGLARYSESQLSYPEEKQ